MATVKPVFVFIPGAWHTPDCFDQVRELLSTQGYESVAIATPSVGANPPENGLHADIAYTKTILEGLLDKGQHIIVVNHSYGGIVGAGAVEGLGLAQRSQAGLPGGVIMVVWLASFVALKGTSLFDKLGNKWFPWMLPDVSTNFHSTGSSLLC